MHIKCPWRCIIIITKIIIIIIILLLLFVESVNALTTMFSVDEAILSKESTLAFVVSMMTLSSDPVYVDLSPLSSIPFPPSSKAQTASSPFLHSGILLSHHG